MNTWKPSINRTQTASQSESVARGLNLADARKAIQNQDYEQAIRIFETILKNDPQSATAWLGLASVHFRRNEFDTARTSVQSALDLDPMSARAHLLLGFIDIKREALDEAEQSFQTALDIDPRQHRALTGLARCYLKKQDWPRAEAKLLQAIKYNPQLVNLRLFLARLYRKIGQKEKASTVLKSTEVIAPRNVAVKVLHAQLLYKENDLNGALAMCQEAVKLDENNVQSNLLLGRISLKLHNHEQAQRAYKRVIEQKPRTAFAYLRLAESLIADEKYDEALEFLNDLPSTKRSKYMMHKLRGDIYYRQNHYQACVEEYRAALLQMHKEQNILEKMEEEAFAEDENWEEIAEALKTGIENSLSEED